MGLPFSLLNTLKFQPYKYTTIVYLFSLIYIQYLQLQGLFHVFISNLYPLVFIDLNILTHIAMLVLWWYCIFFSLNLMTHRDGIICRPQLLSICYCKGMLSF